MVVWVHPPKVGVVFVSGCKVYIILLLRSESILDGRASYSRFLSLPNGRVWSKDPVVGCFADVSYDGQYTMQPMLLFTALSNS